MFFDKDDGYSAEYIYGNYFERVNENRGRRIQNVADEEDGSKVKWEGILARGI